MYFNLHVFIADRRQNILDLMAGSIFHIQCALTFFRDCYFDVLLLLPNI